jgi:predicted nucleic acid-binding protein
VAALADTNVLVYRYDWRYPEKQRRAGELLRRGAADASVVLAQQTLVEFVAVVGRPVADGLPLVEAGDARETAELILAEFEVLYPDEELLRIALRGAAAFRLSWYDAQMWAYAERFGLETLYSEDFQHQRLYGTVEAIDPFR